MKFLVLVLSLVGTFTVNKVAMAQEINAVEDIDEKPAPKRPAARGANRNVRTVAAGNIPDYDVRAAYGLLQSDSVIGGSEFEAELPMSEGHFRSYEFRWNTSKALWKLRYRNQSTIFKGLDAVTPNAIDSVKHSASASFSVKPFSDSSWSWLKNMSFGRGLYFNSRSVNRTQPKAVATSGHSAGFLFDLENIYNVATNLDVEAHAEFGLPFMFREYYDRTGYYTYGYNVEGGTAVSYSVVPWQQWSIGANFKRSAVQFSGMGEQGVNNGSDVQWDLWFPIELRIRI